MSSESRQQKLLNLLILPILGLIIGLYYQILEFDFLINFDDDLIILNSPEFRELSWENIKFVFTNFREGLYHPITSLSWMLEIHFFGLDSHVMHHTNLILHLINTILIFVLGKKISGRIDVGLITALLFGLHPMHVENVAWVSSRKDLMVTLFFLSSMVSYSAFLNSKKRAQYALTFIFALLAMLSKASAVVLPLILILMDWLKDKSTWKSGLINKVPFFLLSIIFGVANIFAQADYGYIRELSSDLGIIDRISFVFYATFYYLQKFLIPLELIPKNLYPESSSEIPFYYYISILILPLLAYSCYLLRKKLGWLIFGLLFFLFAIAPTLKLIPTGNDIVSNRYAYLAFIGLYISIAWYISKLKMGSRIALVMVIAALWFRESYLYAKTFENSYSVWSAVIDGHSDREWGLAMAYNERGQVSYKEGKYQLAEKDINRALNLVPDMTRALMNRANLYDRSGKFQEALDDLNRVIEMEENNIDAIKIRSTVYGKMNETGKALEDVDRALKLDPDNPELYNNLGILYSMQDNFEEASVNFQKAIELAPYYLQAHMNLGKLYIDVGRNEEALRQLAIVYEKDPDLYYNAYLLGRTYFNMGEDKKAEQILRKFAVEEKQASQIANSLQRDSLIEESIPYYTIAMGDKDIRSKSLYQRAQAFKAVGKQQEALDDLLALIEVVPNPQFFFEIAELFKNLGNMEECCKFLHEADEREHPQAPALIDKYCAGEEGHTH